MSEKFPPYVLQEGLIEHPAEAFRLALQQAMGGQQGVTSGNGLRVTQASPLSMNVSVLQGAAVVNGGNRPWQGAYSVVNDGTVDVALDAPDATNPRIDLIIARVRDSVEDSGTDDDWILDKVTGIPSGGTPVPPSVPVNCLPLALVRVDPSPNSNITDADITDIRPQANQQIPPGSLVPFAGVGAAPAGWLFCDGRAVSRTQYAELYFVLGTTYGAGDGSTTFRIPDLRGRVVMAKDNLGGSAAGRVSGAWAAQNGGVAGEEKHILTVTELPPHRHYNPHQHVFETNPDGSHHHEPSDRTFQFMTLKSGAPFGAAAGTSADFATHAQTSDDGQHTHTGQTNNPIDGYTENTGSGSAHNVMQPTMAMSYLIKT